MKNITKIYECAARRLGLDIDNLTQEDREDLEREVDEVLADHEDDNYDE